MAPLKQSEPAASEHRDPLTERVASGFRIVTAELLERFNNSRDGWRWKVVYNCGHENVSHRYAGAPLVGERERCPTCTGERPWDETPGCCEDLDGGGMDGLF
jgi:hypothetical protein